MLLDVEKCGFLKKKKHNQIVEIGDKWETNSSQTIECWLTYFAMMASAPVAM